MNEDAHEGRTVYVGAEIRSVQKIVHKQWGILHSRSRFFNNIRKSFIKQENPLLPFRSSLAFSGTVECRSPVAIHPPSTKDACPFKRPVGGDAVEDNACR